MELDEAYRECERITWTQARNFAYGIRLLPERKRRGLAVIYAFARRIDDIGDGELPADEKIAALEDARLAIADLAGHSTGHGAGHSTSHGAGHGADDPVLLALADVERSFPIPMAAFGELIDGCVADVRGTSYQSFEDLLYYCRCVAGSVGRLSLGIFGTSADPVQAAQLADSLGVALQLTNILRDVREDHQNGRVYLPAEDLAKFEVVLPLGGNGPSQPPLAHGGAARPISPPIPPGPGQFARLMEFEADRARDWYATGLGLLPMLDRRSAACTGAMAGIYRRLLDRIAAQPGAVLTGRVSLPAREKAMVAVKALAGRIG